MVGPGEYDIPQSSLGKKGGLHWHPPKQQKKSALSTLAAKTAGGEVVPAALAGGPVENTPGPGYYLAEKAEVFPIYKYKQSSMFASKVDRLAANRQLRNS